MRLYSGIWGNSCVAVVCSFPSVFTRTCGGCTDKAKTGTESVTIIPVAIINMTILPMSCLERLTFGYFRSFPQVWQEFSLVFVFESHIVHGVTVGFVVKIWSFNIFSDRDSIMIDPRKMRTGAPNRWKTSQATFTPCQNPSETRVVIRKMVST